MGTDSSSSVTLLALSTEPAHTHPHLRLHYILPLEIVFERSAFYNPPPRWRLQLLPNEDISHQVKTFSVFLQLLIQPVAIPKLVSVCAAVEAAIQIQGNVQLSAFYVSTFDKEQH